MEALLQLSPEISVLPHIAAVLFILEEKAFRKPVCRGRKSFSMRIFSFAAAAASLIFAVGCAGKPVSGTVTEKTVFAMDTAVTLKGDPEDVAAAEEIITGLDLFFSRYSEDSDVYALNHRQSVNLSEDTRDIIYSACALSEQYGSEVSIFAGDITDCWNINSENPSVPSESEIAAALESFRDSSFSLERMSFADENGSIDLGSVAKGYAMDKLRSELGEDTFFIASASSSILLNGTKPDGGKFTVSIRDPENGEASIGTIKTDACFISTSGGYERFFEADGKRYTHIFDLSTGCPAESDLTSVTVLCQSGIESDFLSTLIYTGGTERLNDFIENEDIKVVAVSDNKEIYLSSGIDFEPEPDSGYTIKEPGDV